MTQKLEELMCKHIQNQTGTLKKYLLAASDSQEQYLCYLYVSIGTVVPSIDIRNCELLTDAQLFKEEVKLTRDGRNRYKHFYLTDLGKEIAMQMKEEKSTSAKTPQQPAVIWECIPKRFNRWIKLLTAKSKKSYGKKNPILNVQCACKYAYEQRDEDDW